MSINNLQVRHINLTNKCKYVQTRWAEIHNMNVIASVDSETDDNYAGFGKGKKVITGWLE